MSEMKRNFHTREVTDLFVYDNTKETDERRKDRPCGENVYVILLDLSWSTWAFLLYCQVP